MPRPKQSPSPNPLSQGQAAYVLDRMISERRISQGEIKAYISDMSREISDLEQRLASLRAAQGGASSGAAAPAAAEPVRRRPGRPPGSGARKGRPGRPPAAAAPQAASAAPAAPSKGGKKRKASITPEQLASRQLQGRYLALVRQFPQKKRAEFAKVAKERGREVAIKEMQDARK